jgi:hypothetical protein
MPPGNKLLSAKSRAKSPPVLSLLALLVQKIQSVERQEPREITAVT